MLRWLSSLLLLMLASGCSAQEPMEPESPDVVTGYVSGLSTISEPYTEAENWEQTAKLAAWREGNGPIEVTELRVRLSAETQSALRDLAAQLPKQRLVRMRVSEGVTRSDSYAEADLAEALGPGENAELLAAAEAIFNPDPIEDDELGIFRADGDWHDAFTQQSEWFDRPVTTVLMLRPYGPKVSERTLTSLRAVWDDRAKVDQQVREAIVAAHYATWRDTKRSGSEPVIDEAAFGERFDLRAASVWPDGRAELIYFAEDFSWTSRITARVSKAGNDEWLIELKG